MSNKLIYRTSLTPPTPPAVQQADSAVAKNAPLTYTEMDYNWATLAETKVDKLPGKGLSSADFTAAEKNKLALIANGANNYVHPTVDGTLHVPVTGVTSYGKVLTAGSTPGSISWEYPQIPPPPTPPTAASIGLGNVNNTSDIDKPISTATLNALNNKSPQGHTHTTGDIQGVSAISVPPGAVMYFAMLPTPNGWLRANGAAVSRTTFANLFAAIGTWYGHGDGSTTFNLPDLRGEFIRGFDGGRNVDSGRVMGSTQSGTVVSMGDPSKSYMTSANFYNNADSNPTTMRNLLGGELPTSDLNTSLIKVVSGWNNAVWIDPTSAYDAGMSTRPRNIALVACIKY